jgi:phosphoenolpyruvate carboxykinase (GTP)
MVGEVGQVRRDPMAMKPFCGYNFADYWAHWLSFPERSEHLPKIFHVNWFRQNNAGEFLWPGFGENIRVLEWIIDRVENRAGARETPIGFLPHIEDLNTNQLDISAEALDELTSIDVEQWRAEMASILEYLESYGDRLPDELRRQQKIIADALNEDLAEAV